MLTNFEIGVTRDIEGSYTYSFFENIPVGQIVSVNFRNKDTVGVVLNEQIETEFSGKIKKISNILPYQISDKYIKFAEFVARYNLIKFGSVLKLIVPFSVDLILSAEKNVKSIHSVETKKIKLNDEQQNAVDIISNYQNEFKTFLVHGITGSGKTEVFLEIAKSKISENKQVLILVPEIALSDELAKNVANRCGADVFIWHNSVSPSKKLAIWKKALNGDKMIIVGARSALFVPFKNLGMIVIDEEHDMSFKQSETAIYNARDMAIYLGSCFDIPVILSSATPSVESYNNAISGKYEYIKLNSRYFENATLPNVHIDDLRKEKLNGALSSYSIKEINECLEMGKQALIFVNRRGHTPKILCRSCGWKMTCPACSAWLCYHQGSNQFVCHHCGFKTNVKKKCAECGDENLSGIGTGIEKVFEECKNIFPNARIDVLSSDTIDTPKKISKAIARIKNNEVDIILGTQIVAKGHNFDNLNLVVVTCVDAMLYGEDFRSIEKAFQMVSQVSGRAGRIGDSNSKVIIQTYNPNDELMKILENHDSQKLYENEIRNRKLMKMPPFGKMASIIISAMSEMEVSDFAKKLVKIAPRSMGVKVIGPVQPSLYKLRSRYRLRILITSNSRIQDYIKNWLDLIKIPNNIRLSVDIDPYDFY